MIQVIGVRRLLGALTATSIVVNVALYYLIITLLDEQIAVYKIVAISSSITSALIFLIGSSVVWNRIWRLIGRFSESLYPNLSGTWHGEILHATGSLPVTVRIRQSALDTILDLRGKDLYSTTLSATPRSIEGQHFLYYTYESKPLDPSRASYTGTAILLVDSSDEQDGQRLSLKGHYYTARGTTGEIHLVRESRALPPQSFTSPRPSATA